MKLESDNGGAGPVPTEQAAEERTPRTLGRYVILYALHRSAAADVYVAYDPELDRKVAIKLLSANQRPGPVPEQAPRAHPHLITVHDVGTFGPRVFIAMEFVAGGSLTAWLAQGAHPWEEIVRRFLDAGAGLVAAHAQGLAHRGFAANAVLLDAAGRARVLGFYRPVDAAAHAVAVREDRHAFIRALRGALCVATGAAASVAWLARVPAPVRRLLQQPVVDLPQGRPRPSGELAALLRSLQPRARRTRLAAVVVLAIAGVLAGLGYYQKQAALCRSADTQLAPLLEPGGIMTLPGLWRCFTKIYPMPGRRKPKRSWGSVGVLWAVLGGIFGVGCGLSAQDGDCGPYLSSGECQTVRTGLGTLDPRPPPDPTNRFGRCVHETSAECIREEAAAELGHRLFFDRCLSAGKEVACVTCHQPGQAFTDNRVRPILTPPIRVPDTCPVKTKQLPLIENPTEERVRTAPPLVQPQLDEAQNPLAKWNSATMMWEAVVRRPTASLGSFMGMPSPLPATPRHSPTLYNVAYGGGVVPLHGERTYGVTWMPWDGRYDSAWSLVADVLEFGATQNTDRAAIAIRIGQKHRNAYETMLGGVTLPNFEEQQTIGLTSKFVYLRHGAPNGVPKAPDGKSCWFKKEDCPATVIPPSDEVRNNVNEVFVNAGKALAAYLRQLRSASSPYDRWLNGDQAAMSAAAQRGLQLFIGKAECLLCHNGPNFTDFSFHNLGVPVEDPEQRIAGSVMPAAADDRSACFDGLNPSPACPDPGRQGWQLRAAGQCSVDKAQFGTRAVSCLRVDQPKVIVPSDGMSPPGFFDPTYDVAVDCRSAASDASDKDQQCMPATLVAPSKCAYQDILSCGNDPLCQWVSAPAKSSCQAIGTCTDPNQCAQDDDLSCQQDPLCKLAITPAVARCVARAIGAELGQFKTPSLRNVALTFPYMHNGLLADYGPAERLETTADDPTPHLRHVVEFYNRGGGTPDIGTRDPLIRPLHLAGTEIVDLVEFLKALTDNSMAAPENRWTSPPVDFAEPMDCPN